MRRAAPKKRPTTPLSHAAKVSRLSFKRVVWSFVTEETVASAGRRIGLSANSVSAIHRKLRVFFLHYGLFPSKSVEESDVEEAHLHLGRYIAKRFQMRSPESGPDVHFAETCWRAHYRLLKGRFEPNYIHRLMYRDLMEFIRRFGPVGVKTVPTAQQREEGSLLALEQLHRLAAIVRRRS